MKKLIAAVLALAMALVMCACGTPAKPQQPSEKPTEKPAQTTALTDTLTKVNIEYHSGVAGCSLKAAALAGEMLDWYVSQKPADADVTAETAAFFATLEKDASQEFCTKLDDVYYAAMQTCASNGADFLSSAGYEAKGTWDGSNAKTLFAAVYNGTGAIAPCIVAIYSPDDQAERYLINYVTMDELAPETLLEALINAGVVNEGVKVNASTGVKGMPFELDLNGEFQKQAASLGTSGEYMLVGSVVNTYLAAFGADSMKLTVEGKNLTTGHQVYDEALTPFADNVAAE